MRVYSIQIMFSLGEQSCADPNLGTSPKKPLSSAGLASRCWRVLSRSWSGRWCSFSWIPRLRRATPSMQYLFWWGAVCSKARGNCPSLKTTSSRFNLLLRIKARSFLSFYPFLQTSLSSEIRQRILANHFSIYIFIQCVSIPVSTLLINSFV